ncbi:MAG: DUF4252 domain-containing protein [Bacteroidales bacterium]|nr:DUF4252 domain-containing protein [Bacteroidales bacterium]
MRIKIVLAALCLFIAGIASAQSNLYNKFSDRNGITSVHISKTILKMMGDKKVGPGLNLNGLSDKIDDLYVFTTENQEASSALAKEEKSYKSSKKYEELIKVKDTTDDVAIYIRNGKKYIEEIIMFVHDKESQEYTIVQIIGRLTKDDINKLADL